MLVPLEHRPIDVGVHADLLQL
eukprot:SAG31_NODE_4773_length_2966_cov_1.618068_1_plen_21_part_10